MVRVSVSGSYSRAPLQVAVVVWALRSAGAEVLTPREPTIVDSMGDFVFVASDTSRTIRTVQDAHLDAIDRSDLLWLIAPDGQLGDSSAMAANVHHPMAIADLRLAYWYVPAACPYDKHAGLT